MDGEELRASFKRFHQMNVYGQLSEFCRMRRRIAEFERFVADWLETDNEIEADILFQRAQELLATASPPEDTP